MWWFGDLHTVWAKEVTMSDQATSKPRITRCPKQEKEAKQLPPRLIELGMTAAKVAIRATTLKIIDALFDAIK